MCKSESYSTSSYYGDYFRTLFSLGENRGLINFFNILTLCLLFEIRPHRCKCCWSSFTEAWVNIESVYYSYKTLLYDIVHTPSHLLHWLYIPSTPSNLWNYLLLPTCVLSTHLNLKYQFIIWTWWQKSEADIVLYLVE